MPKGEPLLYSHPDALGPQYTSGFPRRSERKFNTRRELKAHSREKKLLLRSILLRFRSRFQDVAEKLENCVLVATYNDAPVLQVVANSVKR